jgi:hypothetical protein
VESHLNLPSSKKAIQNFPVTRSVKPNQISEVERKENLLDRGDLRIRLHFTPDALDQGEIGPQPLLLFREEI